MALLRGQPALIRGADACLHLFVCADDGQVHTIRQVAPSNGWTGWSSLGSPGTEHVAWVTVAPANFIDVIGLVLFAVGQDGQVFESRQATPDQAWSAWAASGITSSGAVAAVEAFGGIDTAFVVSAGTLFERGAGTVWQPRPGPALATGPTVGVAEDGRLEVFAIGEDAGLWHLWQTAPGGPWSAWFTHGSPRTATLEQVRPTVAPSADGRLEAFAIGADVRLWHLWQTSPNDGWSDWFSHGSPDQMPPGPGLPNSPGLAPSANGRLELFMSGTEGATYHIWQTSPNDGWSGWFSHGVPGGLPGEQGIHPSPAAAASADGRLELFVVGPDGQLWHQWQTSIDNGWTPSWTSHGHP